MDDFSDDDDLIDLAMALLLSQQEPDAPEEPPPSNTHHTTVEEWLQQPTKLYSLTGLSVRTFQQLCQWFRNTGLDDGHIRLEEKVMIFLHICRKGAGYRESQIIFNRSLRTISGSFHIILKALLLLHKQNVRQPDTSDPIPPHISTNFKFMPYFKHCVGAIDGTHIHARIPVAQQAPWKNRKGFFSQNVFAACGFDLRFTFVYPGWEGSAHDSYVLDDAARKGYWKPPKMRYFLADAGYGNSSSLLTPYPKTRYHLREQWAQGETPASKEELFNLRHAQLRNAIERIFGILKRKFMILQKPAEFSIQIQINLIFALTALFNFIADEDRVGDVDFDFQYTSASTDSEVEEPSSNRSSTAGRATTIEKVQMQRFRDKIATKMYEDYLTYKTAIQ